LILMQERRRRRTMELKPMCRPSCPKLTTRVSMNVGVFLTFDKIGKIRRNFILISSKFRCFDFPKLRFRCQIVIMMSKSEFQFWFRFRLFTFDEMEFPTKFHTDFVEIST
jgi:hypothetical protein